MLDSYCWSFLFIFDLINFINYTKSCLWVYKIIISIQYIWLQFSRNYARMVLRGRWSLWMKTRVEVLLLYSFNVGCWKELTFIFSYYSWCWQMRSLRPLFTLITTWFLLTLRLTTITTLRFYSKTHFYCYIIFYIIIYVSWYYISYTTIWIVLLETKNRQFNLIINIIM